MKVFDSILNSTVVTEGRDYHMLWATRCWYSASVKCIHFSRERESNNSFHFTFAHAQIL